MAMATSFKWAVGADGSRLTSLVSLVSTPVTFWTSDVEREAWRLRWPAGLAS